MQKLIKLPLWVKITTGAWSGGSRVRFVVCRPRFDSLAESDQKTLKVGIHSFPA